MDDALAHWLRLREPTDLASRSEALTRRIADALPVNAPVRILDLATGTGSNIRYLADRLSVRSQEWLAVDRSPLLLEALPSRMASWAAERGCEGRVDAHRCLIRGAEIECRVETRQMDLGTLDGDDIFAGRHLVTASALLDLVSASWLDTLAARCREAGACALFAITYNGRSTCAPLEPEDEMVRTLMNRHQKTDKGLGGPAVGPDAVDAAERSFTDAGYRVEREASDWALGPGDGEFQQILVEGWAQAATGMAPDQAAPIARWLDRRRAHIDTGRSRIVVGHDDLAAFTVAR